ncbi:MAG: acyltransferase family protein [Chthoniobacterales bacterium]
MGVDLFFVLSGYLIGGQLLGYLARDQSIKVGRFLVRRAFRIMPSYFAILAIYFGMPSLPASTSAAWRSSSQSNGHFLNCVSDCRGSITTFDLQPCH